MGKQRIKHIKSGGAIRTKKGIFTFSSNYPFDGYDCVHEVKVHKSKQAKKAKRIENRRLFKDAME